MSFMKRENPCGTSTKIHNKFNIKAFTAGKSFILSLSSAKYDGKHISPPLHKVAPRID